METEKLALVGGTLIDGTGNDPVPNAVVLVDGNKVEQVGPKSRVKLPRGCATVDISGKTIMPGMFDCHVHISAVTMSIEKSLFIPPTLGVFQTAQMMKRTLHAGFTTIRDAGGLKDVGFRMAVDQGLIEGPRMIIAGGVMQTGGHGDTYFPSGVALEQESLSDGVPGVQKAARKILRMGYDFIKICSTGGVASPADAPEYTEWTMDELKAIVYEADARGKKVMSHAEGTQGIKNAIEAGVWSVEHGSMLDNEAVQMLLKKGTYLVPTLFVVEEVAARGKEMGMTEVSLAKVQGVRALHSGSFKKAIAAGVKIATGTDCFDDGAHGRNAKELDYMVEYGYTPMQAIVAATKMGAEVCRIADKTGTLVAGKLADLLVVDGDPLADIKILQDQSRMLVVMKNGKRFVNRIQ